MALEDDILATLSRKPGLKGREIASQLGLDKGLVNSTLYKLRLRKLAWQDSGYRWFLKAASTESRQAARPQLDTPLTKLSRYYLHCLSLDDESGVSLFAQSRFASRAMPQGASIFLRKTGNLFNVAITRARATLVGRFRRCEEFRH